MRKNYSKYCFTYSRCYLSSNCSCEEFFIEKYKDKYIFTPPKLKTIHLWFLMMIDQISKIQNISIILPSICMKYKENETFHFTSFAYSRKRKHQIIELKSNSKYRDWEIIILTPATQTAKSYGHGSKPRNFAIKNILVVACVMAPIILCKISWKKKNYKPLLYK